tara:strand:- start:95 stop:292 length:198 start_codon:yes stop_codon:yes gene_type:complete
MRIGNGFFPLNCKKAIVKIPANITICPMIPGPYKSIGTYRSARRKLCLVNSIHKENRIINSTSNQ